MKNKANVDFVLALLKHFDKLCYSVYLFFHDFMNFFFLILVRKNDLTHILKNRFFRKAFG